MTAWLRYQYLPSLQPDSRCQKSLPTFFLGCKWINIWYLALCSLFIFFSWLWKRNCPNVWPQGGLRFEDENADVVVNSPTVIVLIQNYPLHTNTFLTNIDGLITDRVVRYCCQNKDISEIKTSNNPVKKTTACPFAGVSKWLKDLTFCNFLPAPRPLLVLLLCLGADCQEKKYKKKAWIMNIWHWSIFLIEKSKTHYKART